MSCDPQKISPIAVKAGDDVSFHAYTLKEAGVPVDLTGAAVTAQWRPHAGSDTFLSLEVDVVPLEGKITVWASAAQTRAMGRSGVWDLQVAGDKVQTVVEGATVWSLDVTR